MSVTIRKETLPILEREQERFVRFWVGLAEIESPSARKDCVDKVADYIISFAKELGFTCRRIPFEKAGDGVVIEYNNGSKEAPILLGAHMDTVYDVGEFGDKPVSLDEQGIRRGPGVLDCKAGIVQALLGMLTLKELGYSERPVKLILSPDEEVSTSCSGAPGVAFMLDEGKGGFCEFNLESGYPDKFTVSRFGILRRTIRVKGVSAHAGVFYDKGRSAIKEAAYKIVNIEKEAKLDCMTFNCGTIKGGTVTNVVPEFCEFGIDIRVKTPEDAAVADAILQREAAKSYVGDTTAEIIRVSDRPTMPFDEHIGKLAELYNECHQALKGEKLNFFHTRGGSDAAYFTKAGVPAIDSLAPIGGMAHTKEEWVDTKTLVSRTDLVLQTIFNLPKSL